MRTVLHHSEFQNLEALWRGMDMLLRRIETGPSLQVLLVDVSAEEFAADLSSASDLSETGPVLAARRQARRRKRTAACC
jgi:type VI secretion system protein ImpC